MTWYEDGGQYGAPERLALPQQLIDLGGPHGVALLRVYSGGKTQRGWGLQESVRADGQRVPGFMENYTKDRFWPTPKLVGFTNNRLPFAIVMRSLNALMVDIDRHLQDDGADGFLAAAKLDLPPTLAETSRSGAGRHLFYRLPDTWDDDLGFAMVDDVIGLEPGIDVRATGCSYRYPSQRWNHEAIVDAPQWLLDRLLERTQRKTLAAQMFAAAAADPDSPEALIMQDTLIQELNKPVQPGKRNVTMFAIGGKMYQAGVPDWDNLLRKRATEIGLEDEEIEKIVRNVTKHHVPEAE